MAHEFHIYIKSDKQPSMSSIARALSSRGFSFAFTDDTPLHERGTDIGLSVDGNSQAVSVSSVDAGSPTWAELAASAQDRPDGETLLKVMKNTNRRITLTADGEASRWARDVSRGTALLAVGAFENVEKSSLIFYGG
ncbi:MAG: hypothetical protein CL927_13935 [Deltaproteobacteria bacterium]|nr:hypothetical protein [Deltaproteobacteria bacterium]